VEAVVSKIMQRAQTLLNCERCVVVLNKQQPALSLASSSSSSVAAAATSGHFISPSPVRLVAFRPYSRSFFSLILFWF